MRLDLKCEPENLMNSVMVAGRSGGRNARRDRKSRRSSSKVV